MENKKADYSAQARTNPVFLTAKMAVCLMADAGIEGAEDIARLLNAKSEDLGMSDPDVLLGNELVVEAKYRTMCRLIEQAGYQTNVDLPCGYTPKALYISGKNMRFIGLDLPIVANEMDPIIRSLAVRSEKIAFHGIDATNFDSLKEAISGVEGPVCITTEGMMMYFTESEVTTVISNIARLLEIHGGCWITPDPEFMVQFFLTFRSLFGEGVIKKLAASRDNAVGQSDVINLKNSLIVNPSDIQNTSQTAEALLSRYGLKIERINLAEHMPELTAYQKLTADQIITFKEAMKNCHYWKITLGEGGKKLQEKQGTRPFGMEYTLHDTEFKVSLRGRMDTITAPDLLKTWEEQKAAHEIRTARIDCTELEYISSAGLRVFMIVQKALPGAKLVLTGVNDTVKEILETTGFSELFQIC